MRLARVAAATTWCYVAMFGLPVVPVAVYLLQRSTLPTFMDLFTMYGGPWSARLEPSALGFLLVGFLIVTLAAAWAAWRVWNGSKTGAIIGLILLPVEAVFWIGFALPFPWLFGLTRAVCLAVAWKRLDQPKASEPSSPC